MNLEKMIFDYLQTQSSPKNIHQIAHELGMEELDVLKITEDLCKKRILKKFIQPLSDTINDSCTYSIM